MLERSILRILLLVSIGGAVLGTSDGPQGVNRSRCPIELQKAEHGHSGVNPVLERHETALLMLLGFGGFSIILAFLHNAIRKHVFHDEHNLDTTFDAGGNVSLSLTAVTVASQLFWPGDILHSATLSTKNGIAGPFWYAVGIMFNIFIFPMLSVQFKTRAPGAKTYLQIIYARFGKPAHGFFCFLALLTNLVITIGIILAGQATIRSLTKDASDEFSVMIMATLFGSYSFIGGLGTTFYVSYFNACLVFVLLIVFVVKIFHVSDSPFETIGSSDKMYDAITCVKGPEGNAENSFLTFRSGVALLYGVIEIFVSSAVTFCDQASWQSRIAAKPVQGVWGFILAGFIWFAIPATMATTTGMAYIAISSINGTHLLNVGEIDEGLVTPLIAEKLLGSIGGIMVLTMGAMALMSTGSGEVMAVSSIIVFDIYKTYIKPFRHGLHQSHCILCGKTKKTLCRKNNEDADRERYCTCISVTRCQSCVEDLQRQSNAKAAKGLKVPYLCSNHGKFREYQDGLIQFKNWCIIWVTIGIVPMSLVVLAVGIDLNWIFYVGAIATIPCFPPVFLSILWVKATGVGLIAGGLSGLICGISVTLGVAATYPGGLGLFLINTVQDNVILAGTCTSFGVSMSLSIIVSCFTHKIKSSADELMEWQKTQDIDNPLNPWELNYREDLKGMEYDEKPSVEQMNTAFRSAKITAYIAGSVAILVVALVIPGIMASMPVLTKGQFAGWVTFTQMWAVLMAIVVIFAPPFEEISRIVKQVRINRGGNMNEEKVIQDEMNTIMLKGAEYSENAPAPANV